MRTIYKCTGCDEQMPVMTVGPDNKERRCPVCGCKMSVIADGQILTVIRDSRDSDIYRLYSTEGYLIAALHEDLLDSFLGKQNGDRIAKTGDVETKILIQAEVL